MVTKDQKFLGNVNCEKLYLFILKAEAIFKIEMSQVKENSLQQASNAWKRYFVKQKVMLMQ